MRIKAGFNWINASSEDASINCISIRRPQIGRLRKILDAPTPHKNATSRHFETCVAKQNIEKISTILKVEKNIECTSRHFETYVAKQSIEKI